MNELKVLRKVDKKMKLTVINKIAKSKCCLIDDGLKAVSYTHLDVYKRQVKYFRVNPVNDKVIGLDDIKIIRHGGGYIPVSYTHLDVYKRQ